MRIGVLTLVPKRLTKLSVIILRALSQRKTGQKVRQDKKFSSTSKE